MKRNVLITGCSKGIGRALAKKYLSEGWEVVATARDVGTLDPLVAKGARGLELDVDSDASVEAARTAAGLETLDVLINNAAIFPGEGDESLADTRLEWFQQAFATNVVGVARVSRAFLPLLERASHPRLINISSGAGTISEKNDHAYYPYSVSKAALNMLTRAMAAEYRGVVVTALSPGWVQTEMGGENATITPAESAASLYRTILALKDGDSGLFLGRNGETYPW